MDMESGPWKPQARDRNQNAQGTRMKHGKGAGRQRLILNVEDEETMSIGVINSS